MHSISPRRYTFLAMSSILVVAAACEQSTVTTPARIGAGNRATLDVAAGTYAWDPASNHYYRAVVSSLNYPQAKAAAATASYLDCTSSHLATITSAEEDAFVAANLPDGTPWWIGAEQAPGSAEPGGGWGWITGEPFDYTNWRAGEPNNSGPDGVNEDNMYFSSGTGTFVDFNAFFGFDLSGYIVEFEGCGPHVNHPPTVTAGPAVVTLPGQTATLTASAADLDGDALSFAWSFGDGATATTTVPTVDHVYAAAGAFSATVTVTDGNGGSASASIAVTVQTPAQATTTFTESIAMLVSSGAIAANTANPLNSSLANAIQSFANGKTTAGVGQMSAFINKVQAQSGKKIPTDVANQLIAEAQQIIASAGP